MGTPLRRSRPQPSTLSNARLPSRRMGSPPSQQTSNRSSTARGRSAWSIARDAVSAAHWQPRTALEPPGRPGVYLCTRALVRTPGRSLSSASVGLGCGRSWSARRSRVRVHACACVQRPERTCVYVFFDGVPSEGKEQTERMLLVRHWPALISSH